MSGETVGCFFTLVAIGVVVAIYLRSQVGSQAQEAKALREARDNYRRMLEELKTNPTDPDLRRRTLDFGRHYSNLTRQRRGVTVFDEVALANDINAACAAAAGPQTPAAAQSDSSTQTLEQRLSRLKSLLEGGSITQTEYQERRSKILDEI